MWELQSHMHSFIAPSVLKAAAEEPDPDDWLARIYADQRWDTSEPQKKYDKLVEQADRLLKDGCRDSVIEAIVEKAIEFGSTTNGGWEVYLDDGYTSVPWCSDEEHEQYWADQ